MITESEIIQNWELDTFTYAETKKEVYDEIVEICNVLLNYDNDYKKRINKVF